LFLLGLIKITVAQDDKYKALFIYNFTKHIEWPAADKSDDFVIGVVNSNGIYDKMVEICTGKKVGNQDIVIQKFKSTDEVTKCHILFVAQSSSGGSNFETILAKTSGTSTLLVTERPGLAKKGSIINFVVQDEKLKFELNKSALAKNNLKVSSYLENLAVLVN